MSDIAERHLNQLERIKKNVNEARSFTMEANRTFIEFRNFIFKTTLTDRDISILNVTDKPQIEFNISEAFLSRLLGDFYGQQPEVSIKARPDKKSDPKSEEIIEGYIRGRLYDFKDNWQIFAMMLSGGFACCKLYTDYVSRMSTEQEIFLKMLPDPTLVGHDPLAKKRHRCDGNFCFEIFPMTTEEFKKENPQVDISGLTYAKTVEGYNWSYSDSFNRKIILVCDYYEKKLKKKKLIKLSNGDHLLEEDYEEYIQKWNEQNFMQVAPIIVDERQTIIEKICRYRFIESQVIEYTMTDYDALPLPFFDGNSQLLRRGLDGPIEKFNKPFAMNLKGVQSLKNFAGQTLANELENMILAQYMAPIGGVPEQSEYLEAYKNPQQAQVLMYNPFLDGNPDIPLTPPSVVQRQQIPGEVSNTFTMMDSLSQTVLGSYDAALGINDNQLSGKAIQMGSINSNSAAKPYLINYMETVCYIAECFVKFLPKVHNTPKTVPIMGRDGKKSYVEINGPGQPSFDFNPDDFDVEVIAGPSFAIQKTMALKQIEDLMRSSKIFDDFMNRKGLGILTGLLECEGADMLKVLAEEYMQEINAERQQAMQAQQQAGNQPNPEMLKMQSKMAQLQLDNKRLEVEVGLEREKLQMEKMRLLVDADISAKDNAVQLHKSETERLVKAIDMKLRDKDMTHRHTKEALELHHNVINKNSEAEEM